MPRELRIMATITLPDDPVERAKKIVDLAPAIDAVRGSFGDALTVEEIDAAPAHSERQRRPRKSRIQPVEPVSMAPREAA